MKQYLPIPNSPRQPDICMWHHPEREEILPHGNDAWCEELDLWGVFLPPMQWSGGNSVDGQETSDICVNISLTRWTYLSSEEIKGWLRDRGQLPQSSEAITEFAANRERIIFDTCITNSHILSKYSPSTIITSKYNLMHFRLQLANQLIGSYMSRKRAGRPRSTQLLPPPTSQIRLDHHPSHGGKSSRCRYCKTRRDDVRLCEYVNPVQSMILPTFK